MLVQNIAIAWKIPGFEVMKDRIFVEIIAGALTLHLILIKESRMSRVFFR